MENVTPYTVIDPLSNISTDYVEIANTDGSKVYVTKATYDAQQAAQVAPQA